MFYEETAEDDEDERKLELPQLEAGDKPHTCTCIAAAAFTQPPPAYTEASLVKTLEERGIGRPSTYAPTIETITRRGYVQRERRRLKPTELGFIVTDLLEQYFPEVVDAQFTAEMEDQLDLIEEGEAVWTDVVREFFEPFSAQVRKPKKRWSIELKKK